uniref:Uncharacterized protein n=1 Tax=Timema shepardi TaxID=629360 RepID=A0A7R9ANY9_TIMSH|nr:unnamed protein product [Timema shepardi]
MYLLVLVYIIYHVHSAPQQTNYQGPQYRYEATPIPILRSEVDTDFSDGYSFSFETGNEITREEVSEWKTGGRDQESATVVRGFYSYRDPEGNPVAVSYKADENGFVAEGTHLPTPHPLPAAIVASLARNAADEARLSEEERALINTGKYVFLKVALLVVVLVGVCSERRHGPVLERQLLYMDGEPKVSEIREFLDVSDNYKQLPTFLVTILTGLLSVLGPILNSLFGGLLTPLLVGLSSALGVASSGSRIQTPDVITTSDSTSFPTQSPWSIDTNLGHVYSVEENGLTKTEKDISYDGPVISEQSGYKALPQQENYYSGANPHIPVSYAPSYVPLMMASLNGVSVQPWFYHQSSRRYIPAEPTPLATHIGTFSSSHFSQTEAMKGQSEQIRKVALLVVVLVGVCSERRHGPVLERQLLYMDGEPKVTDLKEFFDANESFKQDSNLINTIGTGLASFLTPVLVAILSVLIGPLLGGLFGAFGRSSIDTLAAIATTTFPEHSATATNIGLSHAYSTQQKRSTKEEKETIYNAPDFPEHSDYIMSPHQDNYHLNSSSSFTESLHVTGIEKRLLYMDDVPPKVYYKRNSLSGHDYFKQVSTILDRIGASLSNMLATFLSNLFGSSTGIEISDLGDTLGTATGGATGNGTDSSKNATNTSVNIPTFVPSSSTTISSTTLELSHSTHEYG